jgi:hypothetical protein
MKQIITVGLVAGAASFFLAACGRSNDDLMFASMQGHAEVVKEFLAHGADVNAKDKLGMTALMWGSSEGHVAVVKVLKSLRQEGVIKEGG